MKNSKQIIFYEFASKNSEKKTRLQKVENKLIKSDHTFEINQIVFSKDGHYIATTGVNQDTTIKIYNAQNNSLIESIDINEIKNIDLKFSPNDKFLCVTTYMYEIAVIEFKKSSKFNKNSNTEETISKVRILLIKGSKK